MGCLSVAQEEVGRYTRSWNDDTLAMMMIISMIRFALLKLGWYFFGMARTKLGCSVKWYSLMGLYFKCDTSKMVGLIFKCTCAHTHIYIYVYELCACLFWHSRLYVYIYISIFIWIYAYKYHLYMRDACDTSFDTFLYVGVYAVCFMYKHPTWIHFGLLSPSCFDH